MGDQSNQSAIHKQWFLANEKLWDKRTNIHIGSDFYDVNGFRTGENSLRFIELEELGEVRGKSILHLQCHFGLDSLSLSRMGAKVTAVDFSETAIQQARALNKELGLTAEFLCQNIYELPGKLDRRFDIVFTSYGVLCWLPDLRRWAEIVKHFLEEGGTFYMVEFHPVVWMFGDQLQQIEYSYFNTGAIHEEAEGSYVDGAENFSQEAYYWGHSMADVVTALIEVGLSIRFLHEFPFSPYNCFGNMEKIGEQRWVGKHLQQKIPYLFSIQAIDL
ncbi:MAG: class I SAM-dependent methyltransferase [Bacteroidota bacterium]